MSAESLAAQQSRQQEGDLSAHLSKKEKKEQMQFECRVAGVPARKAQRLTLAWTVTAASDLRESQSSTESIFRPEQQRSEFMSFSNERIKCYWKLGKHLNACCSE